jgi:hypothetical protein
MLQVRYVHLVSRRFASSYKREFIREREVSRRQSSKVIRTGVVNQVIRRREYRS